MTKRQWEVLQLAMLRFRNHVETCVVRTEDGHTLEAKDIDELIGDFDPGGNFDHPEELPDVGPPIKAEAHSDDRVHEVNFDASRWFSRATDEEILALAECDWGGDYPADEVAQNTEDPALTAMFKYIHKIQGTAKECGFECNVDEKDARAWLEKHRPNLLNTIDRE